RNDQADDQQNGDFRWSVHTEGGRSIIAGWKLSVGTDEELIEELSFPVHRRVSTMIFVPGKSASSVEMMAIDPQDLQVAQERGPEPGRLIFQTKTVRMMHRAGFQIHFGVFVAAGK